MTKVVLAGVSTRAAAESAARAGYDVTAFDAFGDLDQHPSVHVVSLPRDRGARFSAHRAARESLTVDAHAVVYLSNFENHPRAVQTLAAGRALWGNPPDVLRRVRDPRVLSERLRRRGLPAPRVVDAGNGPPLEGDWMLKPLDSGGGRRVRYWRTDRGRSDGRRGIPRTSYLQEFIDGSPASLVFAAARGQMVPLGFSAQLIGRHEYGASGFRYCGNVLIGAADAQFPPVLFEQACAAARAVADEFGLVGVNGIDFVLRGSAAYAIEVNPRWSASMELVERAYGISVFAAHAAACADGVLPAFDLQGARQSGRVWGKAIVFAQATCVMGDTRQWLDDPALRDVPHPGDGIDEGQPICTVLADAEDGLACEAALVARARHVYSGVSALADARVFSP
jgi:uncharacterized protein